MAKTREVPCRACVSAGPGYCQSLDMHVHAQDKRTTRPASFTVCVQHHARGRWEVITADGRGRISCETLEDARRIAYLTVAHAKSCELIVRDAYNRIIEHELIESHQSGSAGS